jgi:bacterioferritin
MDCFRGVDHMKGQEKVIAELNARLAEELTAINQYMVHAEMCDNWGYKRLNELIEKRAIVEMKHAEKLIARIIFLEGMPVVSHLNQINIGSDVEKQHKSDWGAENDAIKGYNASIKVAADLGDNGTRDLLQSILNDEEGHIDGIEAQLDQIKQMGIQNYLSEQT